MGIMNRLQEIYDKIFNCRMRLLKALEEKGVKPTGQKNVLSEWGLISILNGYLVSELNTMTVRQVMHLRRKPGSMIYNSNYSTLNRIINLFDYLNAQYQSIRIYRSRLIKDSVLTRWIASGEVKWYHNLGVYIGEDLKPMITENGGANWFMLDLAELYADIEDGYYISDIKATIIENFDIIYFTIAVTNYTGPSKTSIRIYAMSARAFSKLDYTWLLPVDLGSFNDIYIRNCGNSDRYTITTINGGTKLIMDVYASDRDSVNGRLRHYLSKIDEYGAITEWVEVPDYYADIEYLTGQFIISKSYISSYGIESNKQTYCIFLLTTKNILHMIITTGLTDRVQPTASFSYDHEEYGELTSECGNSPNVVWLKTTKGLLTIRNNRELIFHEKIERFIMLGTSIGIGIIDKSLYLYRNYRFSWMQLEDWLDENIFAISNYSGKGRIAFLHSYRGNGIITLNLTSYTIDNIKWMQNSIQADSTLYDRNHTIPIETPISINGHGICTRFYHSEQNAYNVDISFNSGANWNKLAIDCNELICGNFFLDIEEISAIYYITIKGTILRMDARYNVKKIGQLENFIDYYKILYQNSYHATIPYIACFIEDGNIKFYLTDMENDGIYKGSIAERIHTKDIHPRFEGFNSSPTESAVVVLARLWLNNQNLASLELIPYDDNSGFSLDSYEFNAMGALPISQVIHSENNEYFKNPIRQLLSIGSNFVFGRADYEIEENTSYLHMNPMIYKGYPYLFRTKSSDLYFNKRYGRITTLGCNEVESNLFTTLLGKDHIMKASDSDILIESKSNTALISTSEIDAHHQGIAEYVDIYTGKKKRYHGTFTHPNSLVQLTADDRYADTLYVFKHKEHMYQIRQFEDGYAICKEGEKYCYIHTPLDINNLNENTFIVVGNFIYYFSIEGVIRQSLFFTNNSKMKGTIISTDTDYTAIKKVAGCVILLKSGNDPRFTILGDTIHSTSIPIVNSIDDIIEWDAKIYVILTIKEESFLVPYETLKDLTTSVYITNEITTSLDELINVHKLEIDGTPLKYKNGSSMLRFHHTTDQLLIWSQLSDIVYRYDGYLLTYWKYEIDTDFYTITNMVSSANRIMIRIGTDRQSFVELLYSYDGRDFARYDTLEIKPSKNIIMVKDKFYIYNNDASYTNNDFDRYGYYSINHIRNDATESFYLPNGKPNFLFGFDKKSIIIRNNIFREDGMIKNVELTKEANNRYSLNSVLDSTLKEEMTLITLNTFKI